MCRYNIVSRNRIFYNIQQAFQNRIVQFARRWTSFGRNEYFGIENSTVDVDSGDIQEMSHNIPNIDIIVRTSDTFIKQAIQ